ncbi:MAG: hypothetical protein ABSB76_10395 [Streptosporangiaceae bacterium]
MCPQNTTATATAAKPRPIERRRHAPTVRTTSNGTLQTQWWVQEIGEISRPVRAQQMTPANRWPRRWAHVAMVTPATLVTRTATNHHGRDPAVVAALLPASRATAPASDWLDGLAVLPIRLWLSNTPSSQNVVDWAGSRAKPAATVAAKVTTAVAAARYLRVRSK